ncbi:MAG: NAD(P)-binding domain-containing protein [bacterium]|nr:NAD(P)-binding domain-containing protein [bacterium]
MNLPYAVIGAGPMGLCTARQLKKHGIPFIGIEQHSDVGGLWDISNPHSTVYSTAHLISSKHTTEFTEFPMRAEVATYPHHSELCRYFHDYAAHFGLYDHYEFSTRAVRIEPSGEHWTLITEKDGMTTRRDVAGVLIANGTLHHPLLPRIPGNYTGELMHSADYKSPEQFHGKRVLIVGCGNSACDIAVDAVHHASAVDMSVRRGYYFIPKFIMGRAADTFGGLKLPRRLKQFVDGLMIRLFMGKPSDYGLPDPDYKLYESHPVVNSLVLYHLGHGDIHARADIEKADGKTITFKDGKSADYDLVLMATGYKLHYPFIARELLNWKDAAPDMYLNAFHPHFDNLFMMGMVEATGLGWQGRAEQAEMVALYIKGLQQQQPAALALQALKSQASGTSLDGGYRYLKLDRMAYYVNKDVYRGKVQRHLKDMAVTP